MLFNKQHPATKSNRGKASEKEVKDWFDSLSKSSGFTAWRIPDAKAGSLKEAPADFLISTPDLGAVFLDVKELHHDYRLPAKNFSQLPKFRVWEAAGTRCGLIVHHTSSGVWRIVPMAFFAEQGFDKASWDLSLWKGSMFVDIAEVQYLELLHELTSGDKGAKYVK